LNGNLEEFVVALYDYNANGKDKLSFKEGDFIRVIKVRKSGWWIGSLNGKSGKFPSNFCIKVADLEENLKQEKQKEEVQILESPKKIETFTSTDIQNSNTDEGDMDLSSIKFDDEQTPFVQDELESLSFQLQI